MSPCFTSLTPHTVCEKFLRYPTQQKLGKFGISPVARLYMNQHFTAMAGTATTLTLKGNELSGIGYAGFKMHVAASAGLQIRGSKC